MKRVVVIGGGHGQACIVRALKDIKDIELSAIVTMADDGGSTGRLREIYNIPAVGDVRNVMLSMAEESRLEQLLDYRFKGDDKVDVVGHNLGNLFLVAMMEMNNGSLSRAIKEMGNILRIRGRVLPSTLETVKLYAAYTDGSVGVGEASIPCDKMIERVYYDHDVRADREAVLAIERADLIILGIGSLYTSLMPNLIIDEIREAINNSLAKVVYFANSMSEYGETYDYDLSDHILAIKKHGVNVDMVVKHNNVIPDNILELYRAERAVEVVYNHNLNMPVLEHDLLDFSKNNVRHDPNKIRRVVEELLK